MLRVVVFVFTLVLCLMSCQSNRLSADEMADALRNGATGQITLNVRDSRDMPVTNARVTMGFFVQGSNSIGQVGVTDTQGLVTCTGTSMSDVRYSVAKDGYYPTTATYIFYPRPDVSLVSGKWQPWNPVLQVLLKEKRNPISMIARNIRVRIPAKDTDLGFDLWAGDWVQPYGNGLTSDIVFKYQAVHKGPQEFRKSLAVTFSNPSDGFMILEKDKGSEFASTYEAPEGQYLKVLVLESERTETKIIKDQGVDGDKYLVFRVRSHTDAAGNIARAFYGKTYSSFEFGMIAGDDRLKFTYYFNATGARNLEYAVPSNHSPDRTFENVGNP
jgi:hypothetical protein